MYVYIKSALLLNMISQHSHFSTEKLKFLHGINGSMLSASLPWVYLLNIISYHSHSAYILAS